MDNNVKYYEGVRAQHFEDNPVGWALIIHSYHPPKGQRVSGNFCQPVFRKAQETGQSRTPQSIFDSPLTIGPKSTYIDG
jgi:hypothetical protein